LRRAKKIAALTRRIVAGRVANSSRENRAGIGLEFIRKLATEALTKSAGKLGEAAVSADWSGWLHQLGQLIHQIK